MKTVTFRTVIQAALFQFELKGQISDGHWENSRNTCWETWCKAVPVVGEKIGRDFYVDRDNFNFASKVLLDCVGQRMLVIARLAKAGFYAQIEDLLGLFDLEGRWRGMPTYEGRYYDELRQRLASVDLDLIKANAEDESFTMTDLRRELREAKGTIRIKN